MLHFLIGIQIGACTDRIYIVHTYIYEMQLHFKLIFEKIIQLNLKRLYYSYLVGTYLHNFTCVER